MVGRLENFHGALGEPAGVFDVGGVNNGGFDQVLLAPRVYSTISYCGVPHSKREKALTAL